jgi:uncharacterized protein with beta-barrel porin domain
MRRHDSATSVARGSNIIGWSAPRDSVAARAPGACRFALLLLAGAAFSLPAAATPPTAQILTGDYIRVGISDFGTLGSDGAISPGILFDGAGSHTFNTAYDYLTPGTPLDGFFITGTAGSAFTAKFNNASSFNNTPSGVITLYNGAAYNGTTYDQRAVWTGTDTTHVNVVNDYHFNTASQALSVSTTISALVDITGLKLSRFVDPDVVAAAGDSSATNNFRGATGVAATDLVYGVATSSGYVLGLYTNDAVTHNTGIVNWNGSPSLFLAGTNIGDGDYVIGLGFDLGDLLTGQSITVNYAYVFGTDIAAAIAASGAAASPPAPPAPVVIETGATYGPAKLKDGTVLPVFDGGSMRLTASDALATNFTFQDKGGTLDTGVYDLALSGVLSGPGAMTKVGVGTLTLTGANSQDGVALQGGALAFGADTALGAAGGVIAISNGATLKPLADMTLAHRLEIDLGQTGVLDTGVHNIILSGDVAGGGALQKSGGGGLTLSGVNSFSSLDVQGGVVAFAAPAALGLSGGVVVLRAGASLAPTASLTITQNVAIMGDGARFDTGANNVTLSGSVIGSACFNKYGAGRLTLAGTGADAAGACVKEGTLSFNGAFAGNVVVDLGATASGGGLISGDVTANGVLAPGNSPGRLVVAGRVTQAPGSVLALDIDGPTPGVGAGHYDTLALTGAGGVYAAGGVIAPITRGITGAAANSYTPKIGDSFQVVTAEGGVTGTFTSLAQPADGMPANARFDLLYLPKAVVLAVTPASYATLADGAPINARAVGLVADRIRDPAGVRPTAAGAFDAGLIGLSSVQIATALHQASGEIHADSLDAALQAGRATRAQLSERLGQASTAGRHLWGQVGVDSRRVQSDAYASGYHTHQVSGVMGFDRRLRPGLLVGGAVSYGETRLDADLMGSGKSFSYSAHAYAGWRSESYYANGMLSAGVDRYKTSRTLDLSTGPGRFSAKADGATLGADLEGGRRFAVGPAALTLVAGLAADQVKRDGVGELGSGPGALQVGGETRDALQGRLGVRITGGTQVGRLRIRPFASVFATREMGDAATRLDARMQGAGFVVGAPLAGRAGVSLATGLDAAIADRLHVSIGYRCEHTDRAESQSVRAQLAVTW